MANADKRLMCAVGNDGSVYALEKLPRYEAANAAHGYTDKLRNAPNPNEYPDEYVAFTEWFYTSLRIYGFRYKRG
ncbi:MAG: hypothetical protein LBI44_08460 [Oscillospiraceae bacterium]|nr:hypothetical protein [Oscillospiraceae bacterium]